MLIYFAAGQGSGKELARRKIKSRGLSVLSMSSQAIYGPDHAAYQTNAGVRLSGNKKEMSYVLITAAHNEEGYIENTIASVVNQTLRPLRWIIVSDGSVDATEGIVERCAAKWPFIELLRLSRAASRSFASKAHALNAASALIRSEDVLCVGHLDADVSFEPSYMHTLLQRFLSNPELGIAGGVIHEDHHGEFKPRMANRVTSVAGAVQMFRRECFENIGEMLPLECGGEDWHTEVKARMRGWTVLAFRDLPVQHHRPAGQAGGALRSCFRQGVMDYSVGCHPLFELGRLVRRVPARPMIIGAVIRLAGFLCAHYRGHERQVSAECVEFLRAEQMERLWRFLKLR